MSVITTSGTVVYVGGVFLSAGSYTVNRIAKWDGRTWSALGGGVDGIVHAIAISVADVYVGGIFTNASGVPVNNLAKWNGST